jgi:thymidylate synthase (FAD)
MEIVEGNIQRHPSVSDKFGTRPKDDDSCVAETSVHDYGHVALVSTFGSDDSIVDAAQVSYGKTLAKSKAGYRSALETRRLIRYLYRHRHTSPFEQAEVAFYLRMPIFVARQLVRHRTANMNEYSARYSELSDDFYVPAASELKAQSTTNKQGRGDELSTAAQVEATTLMVDLQETSVRGYRRLLELGVTRELARIPTTVGMYTEMYWKCDVHNFMHLLKLRRDGHAQQEIQDYANALYDCARIYFPYTFEAWEDYSYNAYNLSALEIKMLGELFRKHSVRDWPMKPSTMSDREYGDFKFFLDTLLAR